MKNDLWKRHLTTSDTRGCEFGYTVYSEKRWDDRKNRYFVLRSYVDDVFGFDTDSLEELKILMGKKP